MKHSHTCLSCWRVFRCKGEVSTATHKPMEPCRRNECSRCNRRTARAWSKQIRKRAPELGGYEEMKFKK